MGKRLFLPVWSLSTAGWRWLPIRAIRHLIREIREIRSPPLPIRNP